MKGSILIVDENPELTSLLTQILEHDGFNVSVTHDGETAVKKAFNQPFDAIILDVMLPNMNGFDVLRTIRECQDTPVMLLTACNDDVDRIAGFEIGADDYLTKPCNPYEVLARIRAILRRTKKTPIHKPIIEQHHIKVDCAKRLVMVTGKELELTHTEFNILETLIKSPGQAFSKEELTEYALGRKYTSYDRSIDVHISNLRNKLGKNPTGEPWVKTVRGFGYLFQGQKSDATRCCRKNLLE